MFHYCLLMQHITVSLETNNFFTVELYNVIQSNILALLASNHLTYVWIILRIKNSQTASQYADNNNFKNTCFRFILNYIYSRLSLFLLTILHNDINSKQNNCLNKTWQAFVRHFAHIADLFGDSFFFFCLPFTNIT